MFKKATTAISFANKTQKKMNERIAAIGESEVITEAKVDLKKNTSQQTLLKSTTSIKDKN